VLLPGGRRILRQRLGRGGYVLDGRDGVGVALLAERRARGVEVGLDRGVALGQVPGGVLVDGVQGFFRGVDRLARGILLRAGGEREDGR
jgi:hypothetical protein